MPTENDARLLTLVHVLVAPQPLGQGALRMEAWGEWPHEQREAYEELRRLLEGVDASVVGQLHDATISPR